MRKIEQPVDGARRRRGRPGSGRPQLIQSLTKAMAIIEFLAGTPEPVGVTEIARASGLVPATAYRLLTTLVAGEMVAYDAAIQRYSLGPQIVRYGLLGLRKLNLHRVARPHLEQLKRETSETAVLAVRQEFTKVFLDQVESDLEVRQTVPLGERRHLFHGSAGHAILAFLKPDELERFLEQGPFPRQSSSTITDPDELRHELEKVRIARCAVAVSDASASVGAPVFDHGGSVVGSVMVCGPRFRLGPDTIEHFEPLVREAAEATSRDLGFWGLAQPA